MKKLLFISMFLLSAACADTITIEKDEAEKRINAGDSEDYCTTFNWYNDGQCDLFCINPDPDCEETVCAALPECPDGFQTVSACAPGSRCEEVQKCETTIICEDTSECQIENPTCPDGSSWFGTCPEDAQCASFHDNCGNSYVCVNPTPQQCPDDMLEVEKCRFDDTRCIVETSDNGQISCIPNEVCQVPAFCKTGERLFRDKNECLAIGPKCRQTYHCGDIGWCSPEEDCEKETCSADEIEVNKCSNVSLCRDASSCGEDLVCMVLVE